MFNTDVVIGFKAVEIQTSGLNYIKVSVITVGILHIGKFQVLKDLYEMFEGTDFVFNTQ